MKTKFEFMPMKPLEAVGAKPPSCQSNPTEANGAVPGQLPIVQLSGRVERLARFWLCNIGALSDLRASAISPTQGHRQGPKRKIIEAKHQALVDLTNWCRRSKRGCSCTACLALAFGFV
jgi:hypothetical protein